MIEEGSLSDEDNDVDEFEDDEEIGEDEQDDDGIPEQGKRTVHFFLKVLYR